MIEAGQKLVARGVVEIEPPSDAGAERQEFGCSQTLRQTRIAGEDDAEQLFGVELFTGQDAKLTEDRSERFLGLVDDEDGAATCLGNMIGPPRAQRLEAGPAVVRGKGDAEQVAELAVKIHSAALRMFDGADDDVGQRAKSLGEKAQGHALAAAGIAGQHREAAVGDAEFDAAQVTVDGGRSEQRVGGHVGAEGMEFQTIER